jgi:hypothetical protein
LGKKKEEMLGLATFQILKKNWSQCQWVNLRGKTNMKVVWNFNLARKNRLRLEKVFVIHFDFFFIFNIIYEIGMYIFLEKYCTWILD